MIAPSKPLPPTPAQTLSPPPSPVQSAQLQVARSSYYTLYRCNAAEEKLELLISDGPTDAFHTPVSAFLKGAIIYEGEREREKYQNQFHSFQASSTSCSCIRTEILRLS